MISSPKQDTAGASCSKPHSSGELQFVQPVREMPAPQVPPDVLGVTFEPGLTRERKAEILSGVGAVEIIGGMPFPLLDGIYLVRIRTGNDMGLLIAARDALNEFDEVVSASLYSLLGRD